MQGMGKVYPTGPQRTGEGIWNSEREPCAGDYLAGAMAFGGGIQSIRGNPIRTLYRLMFVSPQNSYIEILTTNLMVLGEPLGSD